MSLLASGRARLSAFASIPKHYCWYQIEDQPVPGESPYNIRLLQFVLILREFSYNVPMVVKHIPTVTHIWNAAFREKEKQGEVNNGIGEKSLNRISRPSRYHGESLAPELPLWRRSLVYNHRNEDDKNAEMQYPHPRDMLRWINPPEGTEMN